MGAPIEVETSTKVEQLIAQMAWSSRPSGDGSNVAIELCPICSARDYKFFIAVGGDKDGLWKCMKCERSGNYWQLKQHLGVTTPGATSVREMAPAAPGRLPDADVIHKALMEQERFGDALDYLVAGRGFSTATLAALKIGAEHHSGKDWIVYPYLDTTGKCVYYKGRTVPPEGKDFCSPANRPAMLYNDTCLKPGMEELICVEGEADAVALINAGYTTVVGLPGAGVSKAAWLEKLDRLAPKNIFICYDIDKKGQEGAKAMAARIGLDKVRNLVLPPFEIPGPDGVPKAGKDVNEFLSSGKTLDEFLALRADAKPFDVEGVQQIGDVLDELIVQLEEKGVEPTYLTPWPSLTKVLGGAEPGDVIGIMAEGKIGKTVMGLNWVQWAAERGIPGMLYCMEMLPARLARKWASHVTQTDDSPQESHMTPEVVRTAKIIGSQMPADMLLGYSRSHKPEDVFETIRQAVRRYGIKIVCLDNLQLLIHGIREVAQETSKVMKQIKALAMELGLLILLIIQPNRVQDGQIVAARNAAGSSAIEKDVDAMICLHRNRVAQIKAADFNGFLETTSNFEPQILARVDLSRYSAGGTCTLMMDGAKSTIREITVDEMNSAVVARPTGVIPVEAAEI